MIGESNGSDSIIDVRIYECTMCIFIHSLRKYSALSTSQTCPTFENLGKGVVQLTSTLQVTPRDSGA